MIHGRRAAEARHLRLRPHRHPAALPDAAEWAPVIGLLRRHHLRRPGLPRPDRHEAPHRVLVGGPHGLCDAGHRHPHATSAPTPPSSAWSPTASSPACCFFIAGSSQGPVPHPDQAPRRPAHPGAAHGLAARPVRHGLARPAPAWPASGDGFPAILLGVPAGRRPRRRCLPGIYGRRHRWDHARCRLFPGCSSGTAFGMPKKEGGRRDPDATPVRSWSPGRR